MFKYFYFLLVKIYVLFNDLVFCLFVKEVFFVDLFVDCIFLVFFVLVFVLVWGFFVVELFLFWFNVGFFVVFFEE